MKIKIRRYNSIEYCNVIKKEEEEKEEEIQLEE